MTDITVSRHAYKRGKERLALSKKALDRMAVKAFTKGIKHADTKGQLNKYITSLWATHRTSDNVRIHGEVIFLFAQNKLITVFHVPNELRKILKKYR